MQDSSITYREFMAGVHRLRPDADDALIQSIAQEYIFKRMADEEYLELFQLYWFDIPLFSEQLVKRPTVQNYVINLNALLATSSTWEEFQANAGHPFGNPSRKNGFDDTLGNMLDLPI